MKKLMILYAALFMQVLSGQDIDLQYNFSRELFLSENYFDAVTEFKRLAFFDSSSRYKPETEYYIGLSYKKGGKYSEAISYLNMAEVHSKDSSLISNIKTEIIKCNILRRTTNRALQLISELERKENDKLLKNELILLKGFCFVFSGDWERAGNIFASAGYNDLAELCNNNLAEKYSEDKAKILSAFLPGAGQFYTGEYLNGIISLAWNALSVYLTVTAFTEERIFDGIVTANFLWYRFYYGNIYNAGKFAREKNLLIDQKYLQILQDFQDYRLD